MPSGDSEAPGGFGGDSSGGFNYGFTGMGTTPGLTLGPTDNVGTDYGFSAPAGYDIGGGLGGGLTGMAGYGSPSADYSLASQYSMSQYGDVARVPDAIGASAYASPSVGPSLAAPNANPWGYQPEPGFWGSKMQKALSFFAGFNPVTSLANGIYGAVNATDPVRALVQGAVGMVPGGQYANMAYNGATATNPAGYAATKGAGMLGATVGGALAGQAGAQLGGEALGGLVGGEVGRANAEAAGYGPYGNASPAEAGFASGRAAMAGGPGGPGGPQTAGSGGNARNWTDTLMSIGSGIYGMNQANAQRDLARQAAAPSAAAGAAMQNVIAGDFTNDPGFKAAMKGAARASSQQPGGMAASAAAQAALKYQNDRIQTLAGASGSGNGYANALSGIASANNLASQSLGSVGFGVNGGNTGMPPWLQTWLVQNGMGGPKGG